MPASAPCRPWGHAGGSCWREAKPRTDYNRAARVEAHPLSSAAEGPLHAPTERPGSDGSRVLASLINDCTLLAGLPCVPQILVLLATLQSAGRDALRHSSASNGGPTLQQVPLSPFAGEPRFSCEVDAWARKEHVRPAATSLPYKLALTAGLAPIPDLRFSTSLFSFLSPPPPNLPPSTSPLLPHRCSSGSTWCATCARLLGIRSDLVS